MITKIIQVLLIANNESNIGYSRHLWCSQPSRNARRDCRNRRSNHGVLCHFGRLRSQVYFIQINLYHINNRVFNSLYRQFPARTPSHDMSDHHDGGHHGPVIFDRSASAQGGYQIAALFITLAIAIGGGLVTGI